MRVGIAGAEDRPLVGGCETRRVWQRGRGARAVNLPVERKVESAKEFLLVLKTSRKRFAAVERAVRRLHTYQLPEIIALPIVDGMRDYLKWITESVGPPKR